MANQLGHYRRWTMWTILMAALIDLGWRAWSMALSQKGQLIWFGLQLAIFVIFFVALYLFLYHSGTGRWHSILAYVMAGVFMQITTLLLADMLTMVRHVTHWPAWILAVLGLIWLLWTILLFARVIMPEIQAVWGRILLLLFVLFSRFEAYPYLLLTPLNLGKHSLLSQAINADFTGMLLFVVAALIFMPAWQLKLPRWRFNTGLRWPILLISGLFAVAFVLFNGFNTAQHWTTLFSSWTGARHPTVNLFFTALEAGIGEEWLHRGLIVILLLALSRHWARSFSPFTLALTSGAIFALWHITNIIVQPIPATLNQMLSAFGGGVFLAALYFYSGSISVAMLMHTMTDLLALFASGSVTAGNPNLFQWAITIILTLLFIAVSALLTTGRQRAIAQQTLVALK